MKISDGVESELRWLDRVRALPAAQREEICDELRAEARRRRQEANEMLPFGIVAAVLAVTCLVIAIVLAVR